MNRKEPLPEEGGNMLIVKGESSTEKSIEHHTAGPYVYLRARVEFTRDHLVQDQESRREFHGKSGKSIKHAWPYVLHRAGAEFTRDPQVLEH